MRVRAQVALTAAACAATVVLGSAPVGAQPEEVPGVSSERVLFGQSAAFSGPAAELGKGMRLGI